MKNFKHAQSIIEYICVTAVFAGVSMAAFVLANQAIVANYRGQVATYRTADTLQGQVLQDGISDSQYKWSPDWNQPQEKFSGKTPDSFVNNPEAETLPVPTEVR